MNRYYKALTIAAIAIGAAADARTARAEQLGATLPAPLQSTQTQGGAPNYADTYVTPYIATQSGVIMSWKMQFTGGLLLNDKPGVPVGVQLKLFRAVPNSSALEVVAVGAVHDPRTDLQLLQGYPFFDSTTAVVRFSDVLPIAPGDIVGITEFADPQAGGYYGYMVDAAPKDTHLVLRDVPLGGQVDVSDLFTATLVGVAPGIEVEVGALTVSIDIKPGSSANTLNLSSAGSVPVAILSSPAFDATTVIPETVSLAGARVRLIGKGGHYSCAAEDTNGDGLLDLVCHVMTAQFMIEAGDSLAVLEAQTVAGLFVRGEDTITIVR